MSAKTSATSAQSAAAKDKTMTLLKKPETIVGVVVLSALGILAVNTFSNSGNEQVSSTATESAQIADASDTDTAAPTTADTQAPVAEEIDAISMLANTSSQRVITAKSGDSFWTLAEDFCGTGAAAANMERANGYRFKQLQAGDVIEVICQ